MCQRLEILALTFLVQGPYAGVEAKSHSAGLLVTTPSNILYEYEEINSEVPVTLRYMNWLRHAYVPRAMPRALRNQNRVLPAFFAGEMAVTRN